MKEYFIAVAKLTTLFFKYLPHSNSHLAKIINFSSIRSGLCGASFGAIKMRNGKNTGSTEGD